jgi:hypothetical protein
MSEPTPAPGTTRYLCPLECGWHHDVPPPTTERVLQLAPAVDLAGLPPGEVINAMATGAYLREAELTETALRKHLDTHTTVEFVRTIQTLRAEIRQLRSAGLARPDEEQV